MEVPHKDCPEDGTKVEDNSEVTNKSYFDVLNGEEDSNQWPAVSEAGPTIENKHKQKNIYKEKFRRVARWKKIDKNGESRKRFFPSYL